MPESTEQVAVSESESNKDAIIDALREFTARINASIDVLNGTDVKDLQGAAEAFGEIGEASSALAELTLESAVMLSLVASAQVGQSTEVLDGSSSPVEFNEA